MTALSLGWQMDQNQKKEEHQPPRIVSDTEPVSDTELQTVVSAGHTVHAGTKYILEVYDRDIDQLTQHELPPPGYLIGLDLAGLKRYVAEYQADMPLEEFLHGMISFELVSFSEERLILRKVYDQGVVSHQFYLVIERNYLVVYYSDKKTVYEYTDIRADELSEEDQVRLTYGVLLKDLNELYGILQGYSS